MVIGMRRRRPRSRTRAVSPARRPPRRGRSATSTGSLAATEIVAFREDGQQIAHLLVSGKRIRQRQVRLDRVAVASPVARARDVAGRAQLVDDPVDGTLGDPDGLADVTQTDLGVMCDADQHLSVIGEKRPGGCPLSRHAYSRLAFLDFYVISVLGAHRAKAARCPTS